MQETPLIESYSPNTRWGKQHVEIVLQAWDHRSVYRVSVGGNCLGFSILEAAIGRLYDQLCEAAEEVDGEPYIRLVMEDDDGAKLEVTDDDGQDEEWLKDLVTSIRIVGYDPPTLNELRKMNGADPVPDGDRPYPPS